VAERQPQALPFDAHGDEADAGPGVEPLVQKPQLGLGGRELQKPERGAEAAVWGV
jgi:hypothetical protein